MLDKTIDILGLGTVLVDHQVLLPSFPQVDSKNQVTDHRYQIGGPVPTALAAATRLGNTCAFVGRWANDAFGQMIEDDLRTEQIQFSKSLIQHGATTGFAHVWIDESNGSRTIAYSRGSVREIEVAELDATRLAACKFLHVDGWSADAAIHAAKKVRESGGQVFFDAGSPKPNSDRLIPHVDFINCPVRFALEYFGTDDETSVAKRLLAAGVTAAIFTKGAKGAVLYSANEKIVQPGFSIQAVDTTGAGDVFCGGMIASLLDGNDFATTLKFAAAMAALKCRKLGNREALPNRAAVSALL